MLGPPNIPVSNSLRADFVDLLGLSGYVFRF